MDWHDARTAFPEDGMTPLRHAMAEALAAYGVSPRGREGDRLTLATASGDSLAWHFGMTTRQRLTPDAALSARLPETLPPSLDLRREADLVLITALFEDPLQAALRRKLAQVRQKFPGWTGFGHAGFDEEERDFKRAAGDALRRALGQARHDEAVLDAVAEAARATNLLNWRLKDLFSPSENRAAHGRVFAALLETRDRPTEHPAALATFADDWLALTPDASRDTARQVAEYLLFLCNPTDAIFFKAEILKTTWYQSFATPLPSLPAAEAYSQELRLARLWAQSLTDAGYPPRDMVDVQSLLFVTAGTAPAFPDTPPEQPPATAVTAVKDTSMQTLNTILYGPPGTGKTYATFREAVAICDGRAAAEALSPEALRDRYSTLHEQGRIGFVTFHQSYSYEEFVEGLRPEGGDGEAGFRLVPRHGALREIASLATSVPDAPADAGTVQALGKTSFWKMSLGEASKSSDAHIYEDCIEEGLVLLGWGMDHDWSDPRFASKPEIVSELQNRFPNAEKLSSHANFIHRFRNEMNKGDMVVISQGNSSFRAIGRITGDYEFVERDNGYPQGRRVDWLWHGEALPRTQITNGAFVMPSLHRLKHDELKLDAIAAFIAPRRGPSERPFVLVIDEINRANISKVFGELITLLEEDKRGGRANAVSVRLPYSGDDFTLPANLHILDTMNTADRSIALLDTALRRRFHFVEMPPRPALLGTIDGIDLSTLLSLLNARIEYLADRDHLIGHAFFMGCQSRADIDAVMRRKVLPLLAEYFHEDWSRVVACLGGAKQGFIACDPLPVPPGMDADETRIRYTVRTEFPAEAYAGLQA